MSLLSVNLLHPMDSKKWLGQDFITHGHCDKVKGKIKVTLQPCTPSPPNQCPFQVSTSYILWFLRFRPANLFPPPTHLKTMGENNTPTAPKGCGAKMTILTSLNNVVLSEIFSAYLWVFTKGLRLFSTAFFLYFNLCMVN